MLCEIPSAKEDPQKGFGDLMSFFLASAWPLLMAGIIVTVVYLEIRDAVRRWRAGAARAQ